MVRLCRDTGWLPRFVLEEVTVSLLRAFSKDWADAPPVYVFVPYALGYEKPRPLTEGPRDVMAELRSMFPGGKIG